MKVSLTLFLIIILFTLLSGFTFVGVSIVFAKCIKIACEFKNLWSLSVSSGLVFLYTAFSVITNLVKFNSVWELSK